MAIHYGKANATPRQVTIVSFVIIGLFFGSKFMMNNFMDGQNEEAVEFRCAQQFDEQEVIDACTQWVMQRFEECAEDPPPEIVEDRRRDQEGDFDPDAPTGAELCMVKAVEEFVDRRRAIGGGGPHPPR